MGKSKLVLTARVFMFAVFMISCTTSADWAATTDTIARIWAVDDCEKIQQDDLSNPLATDYANNKVWNGNRVNIFGGRNEIVGFQLIIEGGTAGASSVDVGLPNLTNGQYTMGNTRYRTTRFLRETLMITGERELRCLRRVM